MDFNLNTKNKMKYIILFFTIASFGMVANSQNSVNNLSYSRVITKMFSGTGSTADNDTVPSGMVWKIESIMHNTTSCLTCSYLYINDVYFCIPPNVYTYDEVIKDITPIWLKAGDRIRLGTSQSAFYSIIEYKEN